jgi:adenylate kinase
MQNKLRRPVVELKSVIKLIVAAFAVFSIAAPVIAAAQSEDGIYIAILGAPAAGKSRQGKRISNDFGIPRFDLGDVLQDLVEDASKKGSQSASARHKRSAASAQRYQRARKALEKLKAGELVSDDSLNAIVASVVLSAEASNGFILDGYPMTVAQAEFLDSILDTQGITSLKILYLNIPDEESLKRMSERDRADYKRGFGEERLRSFRTMIGPIVDYYGEETVLEIDATRSEQTIADEINSWLRDQEPLM